jgi:hypothetical protein
MGRPSGNLNRGSRGGVVRAGGSCGGGAELHGVVRCERQGGEATALFVAHADCREGTAMQRGSLRAPPELLAPARERPLATAARDATSRGGGTPEPVAARAGVAKHPDTRFARAGPGSLRWGSRHAAERSALTSPSSALRSRAQRAPLRTTPCSAALHLPPNDAVALTPCYATPC